MEQKATAFECAQKIKLIILDVDGVLTDGGIYIGENGELYKPFSCRDGLGITLWQRAGFKTAIITGRKSAQLAFRAQELKISSVYQGNSDKRAAYADLKQQHNLQDDEIAYIGDDLIDLPIMLQVGLPMAVADAMPEVREVAKVVADFSGGHGAVRELIEFVLKAQGKWSTIIKDFYTTAAVEKLPQ